MLGVETGAVGVEVCAGRECPGGGGEIDDGGGGDVVISVKALGGGGGEVNAAGGGLLCGLLSVPTPLLLPPLPCPLLFPWLPVLLPFPLGGEGGGGGRTVTGCDFSFDLLAGEVTRHPWPAAVRVQSPPPARQVERRARKRGCRVRR